MKAVTKASPPPTTTTTTTTNPSNMAGRELLLEIKRHQAHSLKGHATTLPAYNAPLVRQALQDLQASVRQLAIEVQAAQVADIAEQSSVHMTSRPSILFHHACIQRHKRCLLAYHKHRLEGIQSLSTETAAATLTNAPEVDFYAAYQQMRANYIEHAVPSSSMIDLSLAPPCTSPNLQVRCLVDLGQVVLESGRCVTLSKGSVLHLPRTDVLDFLKDGSMQLLDGEEVYQ